MLFKGHDTAPKRRAPFWETKRGLDVLQIRKYEAIQLAIEIGGQVFGPPLRCKASGNRQREAGLRGDVPPALRQDEGIVHYRDVHRAEQTEHQ